MTNIIQTSGGPNLVNMGGQIKKKKLGGQILDVEHLIIIFF